MSMYIRCISGSEVSPWPWLRPGPPAEPAPAAGAAAGSAEQEAAEARCQGPAEWATGV